MKTSIFILILVLLVSSSAFAQPDTLWTKTFGGASNDYGESVQQTSDGGYIIAGRTYSYGAGSSDVWLIKTDAAGNVQWSQTFGGGSLDEGYSVQQTSDGGYIIAGYTGSYVAGGSDVWLIKTDASGDSLWTKTFGGSGYDKGYSVQQTSDGGYIIAGYTYSYGAGYDDVYLIKTDASGDSLWTKTFGGGVSYDVGNSVQQTSDGGYIIAGFTTSYGAGYYDVYLIKTDALGDTIWTKIFGGSSTDYGYSVQQTGDSGYIIAGATYSFGAGISDVYLIKTDACGNQQWSQTLGGSNSDRGYSVQQTGDGGYIVVGYTESYGAGAKDVYLIRLEAETPSTVTLTLTPHNPPIIIPSGGGSFQFDIDIANNTMNTINIDIWTDVTLPGGVHYPIINKPNRNLPAEIVFSADNLTQMVPGTALAGDYSYNAYIRDHNTWQVLADDSFPFTKLAGNDAPVHNLGWALLGWDDDIFEAEIHPSSFIIHHSASPNPFNPSTTMRFDLPESGELSLIVYDVMGREVARLMDGKISAGMHEVVFDGSDLASGIYFARLQAGEFTGVQKLLLIK